LKTKENDILLDITKEISKKPIICEECASTHTHANSMSKTWTKILILEKALYPDFSILNISPAPI